MSEPHDCYPHLGIKAREALALSDTDRINFIRAGSWLPLAHAKAAIAKFEDLLTYPKVTRMPCYLLVGPSYSGKTSILERFLELHLPNLDPALEATICPVLMVDAPPKPDIADFYTRVLDRLMAVRKPAGAAYERYAQIKRLFSQLDVKVLIIDEIHHLIAGSQNRQREFRNAIKSLSNETKVSIIASGIEEAYNAFNADPQLSSRFIPIEMPRWSPGAELGSLLMTLERRTPLLNPSSLHEPGLMLAIHGKSESMLGDICDLVKEAAVDAIRSGEERITAEQITRLDWVPPSKRKMYRRPL